MCLFSCLPLCIFSGAVSVLLVYCYMIKQSGFRRSSSLFGVDSRFRKEKIKLNLDLELVIRPMPVFDFGLDTFVLLCRNKHGINMSWFILACIHLPLSSWRLVGY